MTEPEIEYQWTRAAADRFRPLSHFIVRDREICRDEFGGPDFQRSPSEFREWFVKMKHSQIDYEIDNAASIEILLDRVTDGIHEVTFKLDGHVFGAVGKYAEYLKRRIQERLESLNQPAHKAPWHEPR